MHVADTGDCSIVCGHLWASAILFRVSALPQYCRQPNRMQKCGPDKGAELRSQTFKIVLLCHIFENQTVLGIN
jgi:hypothetical protein